MGKKKPLTRQRVSSVTKLANAPKKSVSTAFKASPSTRATNTQRVVKSALMGATEVITSASRGAKMVGKSLKRKPVNRTVRKKK
jgi:hypothetical protein